MSEEKDGRLRVIRFWLIGVFLIIIAAYITLGFVFQAAGLLLFAELYYWLGLIFTILLILVWYFIYKWYLGRE